MTRRWHVRIDQPGGQLETWIRAPWAWLAGLRARRQLTQPGWGPVINVHVERAGEVRP